jgi:hypothetical protein
VATDKLSSEIATFKPSNSIDASGETAATAAAAEDDGIGADRRVLVLLSNCAFVRGNIMPSFAGRCGDLSRMHICGDAVIMRAPTPQYMILASIF